MKGYIDVEGDTIRVKSIAAVFQTRGFVTSARILFKDSNHVAEYEHTSADQIVTKMENA